MLDDTYYSDLAIRTRNAYVTDFIARRAAIRAGNPDPGPVNTIAVRNAHIEYVNAEQQAILDDSAKAAKAGAGQSGTVDAGQSQPVANDAGQSAASQSANAGDPGSPGSAVASPTPAGGPVNVSNR